MPVAKLQKKINEQRQTAGYLRDALFNASRFTIQIGDFTVHARLTDINELSARDRSGSRLLKFELSDGQRLPVGLNLANTVAEFSVAMDRNLIKFETTILSNSPTEIAANLPNDLSLISARDNYRFDANSLVPRICNVSIKTPDEKKTFGTFELQDISTGGLGGILTLFTPNVLCMGARVSGKLLQGAGAIAIDGIVSWAGPSSTSAHATKVKVGLRNRQADYSSGPEITRNDRRSTSRLRAEYPIEVLSPLFPNCASVLQLEELSLSGMRARFLNHSDFHMFREGIEATLVSPRLRLQVKKVNKSHITFMVLRSAIEEHVKLFNQQSFLSHRDLASGTHISSDMTQVYTTSGAFSTTLACTLSANREHIFQSTVRQTSPVSWFLRWMQQSEDGRIRAAFLSAPYSDHIWYVGGLAGHIDAELKMSPDFVARFFRGMQELFKSLGGREYFLINWFKSNSWWDEWDAWLDERQPSTDRFRFSGDIVYFDDMRPLAESALEATKFRCLSQDDVDLVESVTRRIQSPQVQRLMGALGLGAFGARYASTSELVERAGHHFSRSFHLVELENAFAIIMLSDFPSNVFLNGILNYPFVYASSQLSEAELNALALRVYELATEAGIACPAFFLTNDSKSSSIRNTNVLLLKEIIWTFGETSLLEFWKNR